MLLRKCKLSISYLLLTSIIKPFPMQLVNGLVCMFGVCTDFVQNRVYYLAYLIWQVCWIRKPCSNDCFKNSLCDFTMDKVEAKDGQVPGRLFRTLQKRLFSTKYNSIFDSIEKLKKKNASKTWELCFWISTIALPTQEE